MWTSSLCNYSGLGFEFAFGRRVIKYSLGNIIYQKYFHYISLVYLYNINVYFKKICLFKVGRKYYNTEIKYIYYNLVHI